MTASGSTADSVDFGREGLLRGLTDAHEREARVALLRELRQAGVSLDELRRATAQDRLALLPSEVVLTRDCRYTLAELLERTGISAGFMARDRLALGLPQLAAEDREFTEQDVESMRVVKQLLDAGVSEESFLDLAHVAGRASAQFAEAILTMLGHLMVRPDDTERDFALRMGQFASAFMPSLDSLVGTPVRQHLRELARRDLIGRAEIEAGKLPATRPIAVSFADLVGFTRIGDADAARISHVVARLGDLAGEAAVPPVRLVKLIGDAAMLVSSDAGALVDATLTLVAAADRESDLPALRAGAAFGDALSQGGDWYGRPVNLASRITPLAPPGGVVVTAALRDRVANPRGWEPIEQAQLKGIPDPGALYRLRSEPGRGQNRTRIRGQRDHRAGR
jgi:adenylate cyclase